MARDFARWRGHRRRGAAALYKDPIAVFSAGWLAERFDMDVVVTVRHPCAFAASIKRLHWAYTKRFGDLLAQPLLMRDFLSAYAEPLRAYSEREHDIVDQAILLWNVQTEAIVRHRERYESEWVFVRLEDISRAPVDRFRDMFERLGVIWTDRVEELVRSTSDASNPGRGEPARLRPPRQRRPHHQLEAPPDRRRDRARARGHRASLDGVLRRQRLVSAGAVGVGAVAQIEHGEATAVEQGSDLGEQIRSARFWENGKDAP